MNYQKPLTIAEIGCNHMGDVEIAKELITLAKQSGADVAKFQKRTPKELLSEEQYDAPHPVPHNSYGDTYGAHREYLELNVEQHKELQKHADAIGVTYSSSVWDVTSCEEIISLNPKLIKVGSPSNMRFDMLELLRDTYDGEIHLSFGMTKHNEEDQIVDFFEKGGNQERLVLYSCTSGYPVPFKDLSILEINRIKEKFGHKVKHIGFSGHHLGISIDIAAYALGAVWIERHFTKDRTWKGTDHAASLEPQGFAKLTRDLEHTYEAMTYKSAEILPIEQVQRDKLKFYNESK